MTRKTSLLPASCIDRDGHPLYQGGPQVLDNFPGSIAVNQRELEVIETYLGLMLDDIFKPE
jgi:hypothetical protein